jgi:hypothetical protein
VFVVKHQRAEVRLREAIDRMAARLGDETLGDPVASLEDALSALYQMEEYFAGTLAPTYYTTRDSSWDGRTLGGLMYARGLVTHDQAETAHLVTRAIVHQALRRSRLYPPVAQYQWKQLAELPPPDWPEKHGRDAYYEQQVQGRELLPPIEASLAFLATLPS